MSLSKVLNQDFRLDYCRLWQSLIKGDLKGIERYSRRLGTGDLYPLFACVLTARSWTSVNAGISQTPVTQSEVIISEHNWYLYILHNTRVFWPVSVLIKAWTHLHILYWYDFLHEITHKKSLILASSKFCWTLFILYYPVQFIHAYTVKRGSLPLLT